MTAEQYPNSQYHVPSETHESTDTYFDASSDELYRQTLYNEYVSEQETVSRILRVGTLLMEMRKEVMEVA